MIDEPLADNPFWDFSLAIYSDPAIANQCIALQDDWDVDVNLLLYAVWLAHNGIAWTLEEITALQKEFEPWRKIAILPLRTVRRRLRFQPKRRYYNFLKTLELRAERHQQDRLWLRWQTNYAHTASLSTTSLPNDVIFEERLAANILLYLKRLEMRPRAEAMWPKAQHQLIELTTTIAARRKALFE